MSYEIRESPADSPECRRRKALAALETLTAGVYDLPADLVEDLFQGDHHDKLFVDRDLLNKLRGWFYSHAGRESRVLELTRYGEPARHVQIVVSGRSR